MRDIANSFPFERIAATCVARHVAGPANVVARGVSTDTRTLAPDQAFFALEGERFDGHEYLDDATEAGAAVLVVVAVAMTVAVVY